MKRGFFLKAVVAASALPAVAPLAKFTPAVFQPGVYHYTPRYLLLPPGLREVAEDILNSKFYPYEYHDAPGA